MNKLLAKHFLNACLTINHDGDTIQEACRIIGNLLDWAERSVAESEEQKQALQEAVVDGYTFVKLHWKGQGESKDG